MKLVGVVTERDVCCGVAADDRRPSEVSVKEIMRPPAACCGADESIEQAREKLHEHHATSLPVVTKAGACCGRQRTRSGEGVADRDTAHTLKRLRAVDA